ncbi:MAG: hypothetical protein LUQ41_01210 [Methanomicrobiales archaeon]|nr:hypothetical protein [Methanomicrobiales archaeon]
MGRSGRGPVKRGVREFVGILEGYDFFRWSRDHLTATTNLMLVLSVATLLLAWSQIPGWVTAESGDGRYLVYLSLLLFGVSAALFALFRAVLYFIEHLMDQSVDAAEGISGAPRKAMRGKSREEVVDSVSSRLQRSIGLWWRARTLAIHSAPLLIPAVIFYLLGIACLVIFFVAFR